MDEKAYQYNFETQNAIPTERFTDLGKLNLVTVIWF